MGWESDGHVATISLKCWVSVLWVIWFIRIEWHSAPCWQHKTHLPCKPYLQLKKTLTMPVDAQFRSPKKQQTLGSLNSSLFLDIQPIAPSQRVLQCLVKAAPSFKQPSTPLPAALGSLHHVPRHILTSLLPPPRHYSASLASWGSDKVPAHVCLQPLIPLNKRKSCFFAIPQWWDSRLIRWYPLPVQTGSEQQEKKKKEYDGA